MRTVRCSGRLGVGGDTVSAQGGICPMGGLLRGGVFPVVFYPHPHPPGQNDRRLWKHTFPQLLLQTVTNYNETSCAWIKLAHASLNLTYVWFCEQSIIKLFPKYFVSSQIKQWYSISRQKYMCERQWI